MDYRPVKVVRKGIYFRPDSTRVLARFFALGDERSIKIIKRILNLSEEEVQITLNQVLRSYTKRHRSISQIFEKNFDRIKHVLSHIPIEETTISPYQKLLIASSFQMDISSE